MLVENHLYVATSNSTMDVFIKRSSVSFLSLWKAGKVSHICGSSDIQSRLQLETKPPASHHHTYRPAQGEKKKKREIFLCRSVAVLDLFLLPLATDKTFVVSSSTLEYMWLPPLCPAATGSGQRAASLQLCGEPDKHITSQPAWGHLALPSTGLSISPSVCLSVCQHTILLVCTVVVKVCTSITHVLD